jgi:benzoyl-CoA reductase/2-hydroxyglutaryl-CoA dehydratase subunit BcrC/BadD/HgdB
MRLGRSKNRDRKDKEPKRMSAMQTHALGVKRYVAEDKDLRDQYQYEKIMKDAEKRIASELEKLKGLKNRPKSMEYFDTIARFYGARIKEIEMFKEKGGKVVGTFCSFVPDEVIVAFGALPIRLDCGFYEFIKPANDLLGDTALCPLARSTIGTKILTASPYMELCDMIISPAPCDAKLKMAEVLQDYVNVHIMNVPRAKGSDSVRKQWIDEIIEMKKKLEDLTGKKLKPVDLKAAIKTYQQAQFAWRKLVDLRRKSSVMWGRDALLVAWLAYIDDIKRWTINVEKLNSELEDMHKKGLEVADEEAPRIMLAGSPIMWPNWKLPDIIEESGGLIVCDELCSGMRVMYDPVVVDEWTEKSMIAALADRHLYPCTCPCFTPNYEREDNIMTRLKDFKADGVIIHVLKGCHLTSFDATKTTRFLRKNDIPVLKLESEYDVGDVGQLKLRIEAFLEMIHARKGTLI